jgi:hypothetical protein
VTIPCKPPYSSITNAIWMGVRLKSSNFLRIEVLSCTLRHERAYVRAGRNRRHQRDTTEEAQHRVSRVLPARNLGR